MKDPNLTIEQRVDGIARWTNPGLRAAVIDAMRDLQVAEARKRLALAGVIAEAQGVLADYADNCISGIEPHAVLRQLAEVLSSERLNKLTGAKSE